jgi:hypothetical protein
MIYAYEVHTTIHADLTEAKNIHGFTTSHPGGDFTLYAVVYSHIGCGTLLLILHPAAAAPEGVIDHRCGFSKTWAAHSGTRALGDGTTEATHMASTVRLSPAHTVLMVINIPSVLLV